MRGAKKNWRSLRWELERVCCHMLCAARMPRADARWQAVRRGESGTQALKMRLPVVLCNSAAERDVGALSSRLSRSFAHSAAAGHVRCHQQLLPAQINAQLKILVSQVCCVTFVCPMRASGLLQVFISETASTFCGLFTITAPRCDGCVVAHCP